MIDNCLTEARIPGLSLVHRGKVRDVFAVDDSHLLMVASDRLSAFDVVLPDPIPGKGALLTALSNFWFQRTGDRCRNHLTGIDPASVLPAECDAELLLPRSVVVERLQPLPVEAIARGYLAGSGWKDYQRDGHLCGQRLPPGLRLAERLPEPIFTPSSKAAVGEHDQNIDFDQMVAKIGGERAEQVRALTLDIYRTAVSYAEARGILIADTKLEFGLDSQGRITLMDELLTPDSSRFWPLDAWQPGAAPPSFDKQFVRDYLETLDWNKQAPGPRLPAEIIEGTRRRYQEAWQRLAGLEPGMT